MADMTDRRPILHRARTWSSRDLDVPAVPSARSIAGHLPTTTSRQYRPAGYIEREASPSVIERQEERAPTRPMSGGPSALSDRADGSELTFCVWSAGGLGRGDPRGGDIRAATRVRSLPAS